MFFFQANRTKSPHIHIKSSLMHMHRSISTWTSRKLIVQLPNSPSLSWDLPWLAVVILTASIGYVMYVCMNVIQELFRTGVDLTSFTHLKHRHPFLSYTAKPIMVQFWNGNWPHLTCSRHLFGAEINHALGKASNYLLTDSWLWSLRKKNPILYGDKHGKHSAFL